MTCGHNIKVGLDANDIYLISADHSKGSNGPGHPHPVSPPFSGAWVSHIWLGTLGTRAEVHGAVFVPPSLINRLGT